MRDSSCSPTIYYSLNLMSTELQPLKVLVVCLGNICRSPMGEAVMQAEAKKRDLPVTVDSAVSARAIDQPVFHLPQLVGNCSISRG